MKIKVTFTFSELKNRSSAPTSLTGLFSKWQHCKTNTRTHAREKPIYRSCYEHAFFEFCFHKFQRLCIDVDANAGCAVVSGQLEDTVTQWCCFNLFSSVVAI